MESNCIYSGFSWHWATVLMILDLIGGENLKNPVVIVRIKYIMHLYIYMSMLESWQSPQKTLLGYEVPQA